MYILKDQLSSTFHSVNGLESDIGSNSVMIDGEGEEEEEELPTLYRLPPVMQQQQQQQQRAYLNCWADNDAEGDVDCGDYERVIKVIKGLLLRHKISLLEARASAAVLERQLAAVEGAYANPIRECVSELSDLYNSHDSSTLAEAYVYELAMELATERRFNTALIASYAKTLRDRCRYEDADNLQRLWTEIDPLKDQIKQVRLARKRASIFRVRAKYAGTPMGLLVEVEDVTNLAWGKKVYKHDVAKGSTSRSEQSVNVAGLTTEAINEHKAEFKPGDKPMDKPMDKPAYHQPVSGLRDGRVVLAPKDGPANRWYPVAGSSQLSVYDGDVDYDGTIAIFVHISQQLWASTRIASTRSCADADNDGKDTDDDEDMADILPMLEVAVFLDSEVVSAVLLEEKSEQPFVVVDFADILLQLGEGWRKRGVPTRFSACVCEHRFGFDSSRKLQSKERDIVDSVRTLEVAFFFYRCWFSFLHHLYIS